MTLVKLLEDAFEAHRAQPALRSMGSTLTYQQLNKHSEALAAYLQGLGLETGSRVAVMLPNLPQHPISIAAVLRAGFILVEVNPLLTPRELAHQIKDSGATAVIVLENFLDRLEQVLPQTDLRLVIQTAVGDAMGIRGRLITALVRHVKRQVPKVDLKGVRVARWPQAMRLGQTRPYTRPSCQPEDLAVLQYTGGTTGWTKGAMLTHANLVANIEQASVFLRPVLQPGVAGGQPLVMLCALPLFHIFALTICFLMGTRLGLQNLLVPNPKDLPALIKLLGREPVHLFPGVNSLFLALMNHPGWKTLKMPHLRLCLGGGMAVTRAVAEAWQRDTGRPLLEGYGLSETSPVVAATPVACEHFMGHVGLPLEGTEIRILTEGGHGAASGEVGEIAVRGPQVMRGYWGRPRETRAAFTSDGFFKTGDLGCLLADGSLQILDRKKDMIIVSGFNVYSAEVERQINLHPNVLESAVIGLPDPVTGERVVAYLVQREPLTSNELDRHCRERLAAYKCPKAFVMLESLPKSAVGKILKRELRPSSSQPADADPAAPLPQIKAPFEDIKK